MHNIIFLVTVASAVSACSQTNSIQPIPIKDHQRADAQVRELKPEREQTGSSTPCKQGTYALVEETEPETDVLGLIAQANGLANLPQGTYKQASEDLRLTEPAVPSSEGSYVEATEELQSKQGAEEIIPNGSYQESKEIVQAENPGCT